MLRSRQKSLGFTIVELLIVVVIIAILATISTVAYANIQDRANASKAAAMANQYIKMFELYRFYEGHYPIHSGSVNAVCLGPPDDFPANSKFAAGECADWENTYSGSMGYSADTSFNNDIRSVLGQSLSASLSAVSAPQGRFSSDTDLDYRGLVYRSRNGGSEAYIHYFLKGTHDCPQGDTHSYEGITECGISLDGRYSPGWGRHGGEN